MSLQRRLRRRLSGREQAPVRGRRRLPQQRITFLSESDAYDLRRWTGAIIGNPPESPEDGMFSALDLSPGAALAYAKAGTVGDFIFPVKPIHQGRLPIGLRQGKEGAPVGEEMILEYKPPHGNAVFWDNADRVLSRLRLASRLKIATSPVTNPALYRLYIKVCTYHAKIRSSQEANIDHINIINSAAATLLGLPVPNDAEIVENAILNTYDLVESPSLDREATEDTKFPDYNWAGLGVDPAELVVARRGVRIAELMSPPRWFTPRVPYPAVDLGGEFGNKVISPIGLMKQAFRFVPGVIRAEIRDVLETQLFGVVNNPRIVRPVNTRGRNPQRQRVPRFSPYGIGVSLNTLYFVVGASGQMGNELETVTVVPEVVGSLFIEILCLVFGALKAVLERETYRVKDPFAYSYDVSFRKYNSICGADGEPLISTILEEVQFNRFTVQEEAGPRDDDALVNSYEGEDLEWTSIGQAPRMAAWLSLTAVIFQAIMTKTAASASLLYQPGNTTEYGYGDDILELLEDVEDDLPPEGPLFSTRICGLKVGITRKRLSRSFDYRALGLSLYSASPKEWGYLDSLYSEHAPATGKSLTNCLPKALAAAFEYLGGSKAKNSSIRFSKKLESLGMTDAPAVCFRDVFKTISQGKDAYPARGWNVPLKVVLTICELSSVTRRRTKTFVNTQAFLAGPNPVDEALRTTIHFFATENHITFMGPQTDNTSVNWLAREVIKETREIPEPAKGRSNYTVIVYDLETMNLKQGGPATEKDFRREKHKTDNPEKYPDLNLPTAPEFDNTGVVVPYAAGWRVMYDNIDGRFNMKPTAVEIATMVDMEEERISQELPFRRKVITAMLRSFFYSRHVETVSKQDEVMHINYLLAHNQSGFDGYLLWAHILRHPDLGNGLVARIIPESVIRRGSKLMTFQFELRRGRTSKRFALRDTLLYWPMSLAALGAALACRVKKGSFPHELVTGLEALLENQKLYGEMLDYLADDVNLLGAVCMKLDTLYRSMFEMVIWKSLTAASVARNYYFKNTEEHTIVCPGLEEDAFYRKSFFGGRNEAFALGSFYADDGLDLWYVDATSLYPSVLAQEVYPVGVARIISFEAPMGVEETLAQFGALGVSHGRVEPGGPYPNVAMLDVSLYLSCTEGYRAKPPLARRASVGKDGEIDSDNKTGPGSRLLFAWGKWEGILDGPTFEYIVSQPQYTLSRVEVRGLHLFKGGMPLSSVTRKLFQSKLDIDTQLSGGGLSNDVVKSLSAKRGAIKLMLNSLYGFWAIKVVSSRGYNVSDTASPSAGEAFANENLVCWSASYDNQTVHEYDSVLMTDKRNIVIGMWTTCHARLRLLRMIDRALEKPWRDVLYVDTDSLHVYDAHRNKQPNFWDDVIMSDPEAANNVNLGGWTDELLDKHGVLWKLTELHIGGLKFYGYRKRNPKGEVEEGVKARGYSNKWQFATRRVLKDPAWVRSGPDDAESKNLLLFTSNYSDAFHEYIREMRDEESQVRTEKECYAMCLDDVTALIRGDYTRIVSSVNRFFSGSAAMGKDAEQMSCKRGTTSLALVFTKARLGPKVNGIRYAVPFEIL